MIDSAAALARAYSYPGDIPSESFVLRDGAAQALPDDVDALVAGRTPVLAYGANSTAEGLARKLGPGAREVPLVAGELLDFDVVYSAHVSPYGAIPGALQHSSGTWLKVHVAYLLEDQIEAVHPGEPNYRYERLYGVELRLATGEILTAIDAYATRHGCLRRDNREVAVSAVSARERSLPAIDERAALTIARDRIEPGADLDAFVLAQATDPAIAAARTEALRSDAIAFAWPR
jgi:hypothetical protein